MPGPILITGAGGLLGANICAAATAQGSHVRALIRNEADARALENLGVDIVYGDITDRGCLKKVVADVTGIIHTAGLVGGTWSRSTPEQFNQVNYVGSSNILDAAAEAGDVRTLLVSTISIMDPRFSVTEESAIVPISTADSPYTRSKRASYYDGMHRACRGQNVAFLIPAAIYGPSPNVEPAVAATSFNGAIVKAIQREILEFAAFPMSWAYVEDAALIALGALDDDLIGARYLAAGRSEDERSLAMFCNAAAEIAGSEHRVRDVGLSELAKEIGPMAALAARTYATPFVDARKTRERLGVSATPLLTGLERTIAWLKAQGKI